MITRIAKRMLYTQKYMFGQSIYCGQQYDLSMTIYIIHAFGIFTVHDNIAIYADILTGSRTASSAGL